jgi:hypothetical protein
MRGRQWTYLGLDGRPGPSPHTHPLTICIFAARGAAPNTSCANWLTITQKLCKWKIKKKKLKKNKNDKDQSAFALFEENNE